MNVKRFILAVIAVFLSFQVLDFIIHNLILGPTYQATASLWRPEMMSLMWVMWLTGLVLSILFVYIFIRGYENRGIGEGLRYGLLIGLLFAIPGVWNQYVVYPVPLALAVKWCGFSLLEFLIAGVVTSLIYKPAE